MRHAEKVSYGKVQSGQDLAACDWKGPRKVLWARGRMRRGEIKAAGHGQAVDDVTVF